MDFVRQLIRCAVLAVSWSVCVSVLAATCVPRDVTKYNYTFNGRAGVVASGFTYEDSQAACASGATAYGANQSTASNSSPEHYTYTYSFTGTYDAGRGCRMNGTFVTVYSYDGCSACGYTQTINVTDASGVGVGSKTVHESCEDKCQAKQGQSAGAKGQELSMPSAGPSAGVPKSGCDADNCKIDKPNNAGGIFGKLNGQWTYTDLDASSWKGSGGACGATDAAASSPSKCPAKQCPGTVNGASICVPCDSTSTADTKKTEKPDPAASGASAPPASTTTTKTTECDGAKCTTTTETTNTDGTGSTTTKEKTDQSESSFCAENPKSDQCADEPDKKSFSGSCDAVSCEGDAIMCAIAREQQKRNCELFDKNAASDRGIEASIAGDKPGDHPAKTPEEVAMPAFDQTNILNSSCPSNGSFTMGGRTVVLPYADMCGPLQVLGNILVALTALACVGIVFVRGS